MIELSSQMMNLTQQIGGKKPNKRNLCVFACQEIMKTNSKFI
jgi:hypothetical protein